jgi:alpha-1,2-mannosyltransferase
MAVLSWPVAVAIGSLATIGVTVWLMRELLGPMVARRGWTPWFALAISLCLLAVYEPFRETFLFGQVNMLLVGLVAADLLLLVSRRSRWAGVGIGLATAIKLTPGIFIVYLLITKRWRAALVASATAAGATLLAAAIAPDASREFWTSALWDTDRVGVLAFISNQSVQGVVARLDPAHPSKLLWAAGILAVLVLWFVRSRRAAATGDETLGLALTGIVGVLISPVTWVHHLVWAVPAFVLILQRGSRWLQIFAALGFAVLCSRLVWLYQNDFSGLDGFVFSNAYVWIMLTLLALTPGLLPAKGDLQLGSVEVAAGVPVKVPRSVRV